MKKSTQRTAKCTIDIRNIPPAAYRLPEDGRKWLDSCRNRKQLLDHLATYANGDGTNIKVSVEKVSKALGWHSRTIHRFLRDLETMGALTKGKLDGRLKTRDRAVNIEHLLIRNHLCQIRLAPVTDSESTCGRFDGHLWQIHTSPVTDRTAPVADSESPVTRMEVTQPSIDRHSDRKEQTVSIDRGAAEKNESVSVSSDSDSDPELKKAYEVIRELTGESYA